MSLFKKIKADMYIAMKAGKKEELIVLRTTMAKLKDKQIEKREELTKEEELKVIQTLVKQRKESIELYLKGGRAELAQIEKNEIVVLSNYIPQMMSNNDIQDIVKSVVKEVGATSMADMGKVMPEVMKRGKGLIDGKTAQKFVQELFG